MMRNYVAYKQQAGAALITALSILLVMTLLALSSVQGTIMNSLRVKNVQTSSFVRRAVEGEILAQSGFFQNSDLAADQPIINASGGTVGLGLPVVLNNLSNIAGLDGLTGEIRDLSNPNNNDPDGRQLFGKLCSEGNSIRTGGCKHMLLTVSANHPQIGQIVQHIGFGYKTPGSNSQGDDSGLQP